MNRSNLIVHVPGMIVGAMAIAGCLELGTSTESSSSSTLSTSSSSSASSSASSSTSTSSTSSSSSSTTSSSTSSSSGQFDNIIFKSDFGSTFENNSGGVVCGFSTSSRPVGNDDTVLDCTHVDQVNGSFQRGAIGDLIQNETYTFSFFFKNTTFDTPFDQLSTNIGVMFIGITQPDDKGGSLVTTDPYPNGWYRQKLTFTPSQTQSFYTVFSQNLKRIPGGEYRLFGFQLERGTMATAYIP